MEETIYKTTAARRRTVKKYDQTHPENRAQRQKKYFQTHKEQWNAYRHSKREIVRYFKALPLFE